MGKLTFDDSFLSERLALPHIPNQMKGTPRLHRHDKHGRQRGHKPEIPHADLLYIENARASPVFQMSVTLEEFLELPEELPEDLPEELLAMEILEDFREYDPKDSRSPRIQRLVIGAPLDAEVDEKQPVASVPVDGMVFPNFQYPAKATVSDAHAHKSNLWRDMRDERKRLSTRRLIKSFDKSSNQPAGDGDADEEDELPELLHYDSPRILKVGTPTTRIFEEGQAEPQVHKQSSLTSLSDLHSKASPLSEKKASVSLPHPPIRSKGNSNTKQDPSTGLLRSLAEMKMKAEMNRGKETDDISARRPMRVRFQQDSEPSNLKPQQHSPLLLSPSRNVRVQVAHRPPLPGNANGPTRHHHAAIARALASKHKRGADSKQHDAAQPGPLRDRVRAAGKPFENALESPRKSPRAEDADGTDRREQIKNLLKNRLQRQMRFKWKPSRPTTQSLLRPPSQALGHRALLDEMAERLTTYAKLKVSKAMDSSVLDDLEERMEQEHQKIEQEKENTDPKRLQLLKDYQDLIREVDSRAPRVQIIQDHCRLLAHELEQSMNPEPPRNRHGAGAEGVEGEEGADIMIIGDDGEEDGRGWAGQGPDLASPRDLLPHYRINALQTKFTAASLTGLKAHGHRRPKHLRAQRGARGKQRGAAPDAPAVAAGGRPSVATPTLPSVE